MQRRRNAFPLPRIPQGGASGQQYERAHALGATPAAAASSPQFHPDPWEGWNEIPAFYTVSINLGGNPNDAEAGSTPLRPEPFVLKRITFATTGDTPFGFPLTLGSIQGRSVECTWADEFTKFLGDQPCLLSALFGDSSGYLDLPAPILFQGRQSLTVRLHRLFWPFEPLPPAEARFDFSFQGVALLPPNVGASGSVR